MSHVLSKTTCVIHLDRAAAARCPACRKFYCPECITEHEGRLTCAACLQTRNQPAAKTPRPSRWFISPFPLLQWSLAAVVLWLIYYYIAGQLALMPDDFHDGTMWE